MSSASCTIHIHGELRDLLATAQRVGRIEYAVDDRVSVKHAIEALGVIHPEVGRIQVGARNVTFEHILVGGDVVHVYPDQPCATTDHQTLLRAPTPKPTRFVLDTHLGRLASYLRLMGVDSLYDNGYDDEVIASISHTELRVLLTRDRGLLKRKTVAYGHCVRDIMPRNQLVAVVQRYCLHDQVALWTRCVNCNGLLEAVAKDDILHLLEPKTRLYYTEFSRCMDCGHIYWRGSHFERMQEFFRNVLEEARPTG